MASQTVVGVGPVCTAARLLIRAPATFVRISGNTTIPKVKGGKGSRYTPTGALGLFPLPRNNRAMFDSSSGVYKRIEITLNNVIVVVLLAKGSEVYVSEAKT